MIPDTGHSRFFYHSALLMAAIVLLSFPVTYYWPLAQGSGGFHPLHHVHAAACFLWFALYVVQTRLVVNGEIARHRALGLSGLLLTGALLPLGYWMAQRAAELRLARGAAAPYEFTLYNIVDMSLFAGFMIAAVLMVSRHQEWHRRFTYMAALSLVMPAATRWTLQLPFNAVLLDILVYVLFYPFLIALTYHDRRVLGRVHDATLCAVAIAVPVQLASVWVARTDWWNTIAPALVAAP